MIFVGLWPTSGFNFVLIIFLLFDLCSCLRSFHLLESILPVELTQCCACRPYQVLYLCLAPDVHLHVGRRHAQHCRRGQPDRHCPKALRIRFRDHQCGRSSARYRKPLTKSLLSIGLTSSFAVAIIFTTVAMFSKSFHSFGSSLSPLDIAPKHAGFVFGIVNSAGSFSGRFDPVGSSGGNESDPTDHFELATNPSRRDWLL